MQAKPEDGAHGSLTRSTVHGVFWISATRIIKVPLNLVAVAVLARLLTPADFGIVAIGMLVKTLSDVLVDGSFGMVLIQRRSISPAVIGASLLLSVLLAIAFAGAIVLSSPLIEQQFDFPQLAQVLMALAAVLPVTAVTTITTALLQRSFKFGALTLNAFVSQLTFTTVAISLAVSGFGLWSLVWAQLIAFVAEALMGFLAARSSYSLGFSGAALREVASSGGMFTLAKLLNWAATSVDRVVIGRFLGATELGFYSRAATLMKTVRQLTGTGPVRVLFSSLAKIQDDKDRMRNGFIRALSVTAVMATLVCAFAVLHAEMLVKILLGPAWLKTIPLIQIFFSAFVARSGYVVAESVPLAMGLARASAVRQGAQLVLVLAGAALGARWGVVGATAGVAVAYWLFYLLCLLLVQRLLDVRWLEILRVHARGVVASLAPFAVGLAARLLLPAGELWAQLVSAALFGAAAIGVLASAPATLLGSDLVRARAHLWSKIAPRLARRR